MRKLVLLFGLLLLAPTESQAQALQVVGQSASFFKRYDAEDIDSISYNAYDGTSYNNRLTIHLKDGSEELFDRQNRNRIDSVVWYDPEGSILATLRQEGNYSNFIRLLEELDPALGFYGKMEGATDLTVFAANDAAWQRFFAENAMLPDTIPWSTATSYEALKDEQKQVLLYNAVFAPQRIRELEERTLRIPSIDKSKGLWTLVLTPAFCNKNKINDADQRILFGTTLNAPWMPGLQITELDAERTNGFLERITVPLKPLGTMADIIRQNGKTDIFAHLLEKGANLPFDPSQASYSNALGVEHDMAAMIVPNDEAMWRFFSNGAGQELLKNFYTPMDEETGEAMPYTKPQNKEELFEQIHSIPTAAIDAIINNLMHNSFVSSVPSKWQNLTDDYLYPLFEDADAAREQIDTCLFASNGIVYVMDEMTSLPGDFTSIVGPAFASNTCKIIKAAIYGDFMNFPYNVYLNAPQRDITFFLPTDSALFYYYDPSSMKSRTPRVIKFTFVGGSFPVKLQFYNYYCQYNKDKGLLGTISAMPIPGTNQYTNQEVINRLKDILYSHTVVSDDTQDIHSRNEYYRTLGGDVVKVIRDASGNIVGAKGTFQIENERQGINTGTRGVTECNVTNSYESLLNGQTYALDAPLVPTNRSLWSIMTNDADMVNNLEGAGGETPYSEFCKLCTTDSCSDIILGCGLIDASLSKAQRQVALKKYLIFTSENCMDNNFAPLIANTPYTAYIPTNDAVRNAIAQGLPTWEDIREDFNSHSSDGVLTSPEDSLRIATKIMTLTNVVKAHFHFDMAIADKEPFQREYRSMAMNDNLASRKVKVNNMDGGQMTVTDWMGHSFNIVGEKNIFVHDYTCNESPVGRQMRGIRIDTHRSGVVHQIDGVLGFK